MLSMLNQAAVEALCSATYLENYLDCMENLPDDLQRVVTQLRELDSQTNDILRDISQHQEIYLRQEDGAQKKKALIQIQRGLIKSQEIGDEKLALAGLISEFIENRTRQLEQDLENLDPGASQSFREDVVIQKTMPGPALTPATASNTSASAAAPAVSKPAKPLEDKTLSAVSKVKRQRRQRAHVESTTKEEEKKEEDDKPKKKKKRKVKKEAKMPDHLEPIDPDEPTYCLCQQVSYGEMIGCDNDACAIEWFHFNCVQLTHKPKGKWYCPKCRGDKASLKRQDLK